MTDSFLAKEQSVLVESEKLLTDTPEQVTPDVYAKLIADYGRLLKNFSRMIRISDRNELRLQAVSDELEIEKKNWKAWPTNWRNICLGKFTIRFSKAISPWKSKPNENC